MFVSTSFQVPAPRPLLCTTAYPAPLPYPAVYLPLPRSPYPAPLPYPAAYRQFHEYYIHGQFHHCQEEKRRIKLCLAWKTMQREEAKVPRPPAHSHSPCPPHRWHWCPVHPPPPRPLTMPPSQVALVQSLEEEQANMHPEEPVWPLRDTPPPDW